jgi:hypothetical protein
MNAFLRDPAQQGTVQQALGQLSLGTSSALHRLRPAQQMWEDAR